MEQKKCLNCLCLVSVSERSCPFCRTPFASGKKAQSIPLSLKKFNPPNIASDEQKKLARISRNVRIVSAEEIVREELSELEISAQDLLKKRIGKYKEIFSDKDPFAYFRQQFSSLEIEEIKPEVKEIEQIEIRGVDVEAEKLKELTEFANLISPTPAEENSEENKEDTVVQEKSFETKSTIRTSSEKITEKSSDQEDFNINIISLVEVLESFSQEEAQKNETKSQEEVSPQILDLSALADLASENIKEKNSTPEIKKEDLEIEKLTFPELISTKEETNNKSLVRSPEYDRLLQKEEKKPEKINPPKPISGARGTNNAKAMEHYNNARNLCLKGSYEQAMNELENSVRIDPAYEQAHILLSRTYLKLKNG